MSDDFQQELISLVDGRDGHFLMESGYHGETWLDLDTLLLRPAKLARFVDVLADRLSRAADADAICGPLLGGGLIASAIATRLDLELYVSELVAPPDVSGGLFRARYAVRGATRSRLRSRRVAIVDDVVNAGSATRATVSDLREAGAEVVAIGALMVLGTSAAAYAEQEHVPLVYTAAMAHRLWLPAECPMCSAGQPLENPAAA